MSDLASIARTRLPRLVEAGARARLVLVPTRATTARRTPFVALVLGLLAAGMVGLLLFNTHMQQESFRVTALQHRADALLARQQSLAIEVSHLRDPQRVAERARALGMVQPPNPAFVQIPSGRVLGRPTVATPADGVHIHRFPASRPGRYAPPPKIVRVPATSTDEAGTDRATHSTRHEAKHSTRHRGTHSTRHEGTHSTRHGGRR